MSGLDSARAAMVLAVLQRWGGVALAGKEVLAATVGGAKMTEPAADLPLALAIWSSARDIPLAGRPGGRRRTGSGGRRPAGARRRRSGWRQAARVGFDHAIVPPGSAADRPRGMRVVEAATLGEALEFAGGDGVVRWLHRGGSAGRSGGSDGGKGAKRALQAA